MSKLRRTLMVGAVLAAMSLTATTAIAQPSDGGTTTQAEVSANWDYYNQATRVPPAELKARMQAEAAQQELSDRLAYYNQATRMSPAQLAAWAQGNDRADTPTAPPAGAPALTRPAEPSGEPGWLVISLGILAAMAVVAGLAVLATRRAIRPARLGQAT